MNGIKLLQVKLSEFGIIISDYYAEWLLKQNSGDIEKAFMHEFVLKAKYICPKTKKLVY